MNEQQMNSGYVLAAVEEEPTTSSKDIEIIEDDAFSYEGFQVVRGEFFAHIYEPSFTFNSNKVSVNTACIKKLPDTDFVQILVNPEEKKLAVRPCTEDEKDSFRWCTANSKNALPSRLLAECSLQRLSPLWIGILTIVTNCWAN